jgi:hypothetical protein
MTRKYALIVENQMIGLFNIRSCAEIYAQGLTDYKIQVVEV